MSVSARGLVILHEITSILFKGSCSGSNFSCENVAALWASATANGDSFGLNWLFFSFCFTFVGEGGADDNFLSEVSHILQTSPKCYTM